MRAAPAPVWELQRWLGAAVCSHRGPSALIHAACSEAAAQLLPEPPGSSASAQPRAVSLSPPCLSRTADGGASLSSPFSVPSYQSPAFLGRFREVQNRDYCQVGVLCSSAGAFWRQTVRLAEPELPSETRGHEPALGPALCPVLCPVPGAGAEVSEAALPGEL